ncbi:acetyltransferase [Stagonosporopsis vannaccii]|nr:acetyltransferase [Stagonosporopsis vannaccii]
MGDHRSMRSLRADSQQPTAGKASFIRCPPQTLNRLRTLNEAEVITLFTPVVPHSPSTTLVPDMDPFEPLGRALPRPVRHVPFRMDLGMTDLHPYFLSASGVIVVVICATENVLGHNPEAFERQLKFAHSIARKVEKDTSMMSVPVVLLAIVGNGTKITAHEQAVRDFPVLLTLDDYNPATLEHAVQTVFG